MSDLNNETRVGMAVDMLFKRQRVLLDKYEGRIFSLSQSFNLGKYKVFDDTLQKINDDLQFISYILALIRDLPRCDVNNFTNEENEKDEQESD